VLMSTLLGELRRMAAAALGKQGRNHTLQPTAIVNEAWIRMAGHGERQFPSRTEFLAFASRTIRTILVDHARRKLATKRGGGARRETLVDSLEHGAITESDVLELEDELNLLEKLHPMSARIIELRFYGGMTDVQIAQRMEVSDRTIRRHAKIAQLFMRARLADNSPVHDATADHHHSK